MKIRVFQKGFNFSQDGPGNRLVYHLQGCNLRCPWCSNPEGLTMTGGIAYEVSELAEEILRSRAMFFGGGGITLTGGEACMQIDAVKELLSILHDKGIHTCIETNGTSLHLAELFPVLDLLIMDLKHYDPEVHRSVTGQSCENTFRNIRDALQSGQKLALRIPLIGGFNASEADCQGFIERFRSLDVPGNATVELLAYHEYGKDKYASLGLPYTMTDSARISSNTLAHFTHCLQEAGIEIIRT